MTLLNNLGIKDIEDLISFYPKKYNIIKRSDMNNISNGEKIIIDGIVKSQTTTINLSPKLKKIIFRISNKKNIYNVSAYNQLYLCNELKSDTPITIIGKYDKIKQSKFETCESKRKRIVYFNRKKTCSNTEKNA